MDVLCFSSSDWHGKWGSRQQVMGILAQRGHRVLFVEQMAGLEHVARYHDLLPRRRQRRQEGLREIQPNLWLFSPPLLLPGRYYLRSINQINAWLVARSLRAPLQALAFTAPVLWVYKPEHVSLMGRFEESCRVYHCIDEFTVGTHGRKRRLILELEQALLRQTDVVFANSQLTFEAKRPYNPHTYQIPSGADVAHFEQANAPATVPDPDVAQLPHPILAFVGNLNEKIDVALLVAVAQEHPDWSLVLVGPCFLPEVQLDRLRRMENVHFLGKRPFATLPAILKVADICLLPYAQGEATLYRSPLKLYEYLATGRPIVSTPHPEVETFSDVVAIAPPAKFTTAIVTALQTDSPAARQQRVEVARRHSWSVRVDEMLEYLV